MTGGSGGEYIPQIRLTREELQRYDESVTMVLDEAVAEFSNFSGFIDTNDWGLVRKRKQMSIYRSLQRNDDPRAMLMVGTGLIPGTLEDVMNGVYCDTTADLRAVKTFLKYKFLDGAVLNVTKKRTPEAPYDFAGVKWFAAKAPWGLVKHRELLTYERMGTTLDENGNELAYHVLQSIERPEWPVGSVKGVKRERTITCYLYRRHQNNRIQCFLWGQVYDIGSVSQRQRLAEYVVAGTWLNVVRSVNSAEAKKCSKLMVAAEGRSLQSNNRQIFQIEVRTGKPFEKRFCKFCISKVISPPVLATRRESLYADPMGRAPTMSSSFGSKSRGRSDSSAQRQDAVSLWTPKRSPSGARAGGRKTLDLTDIYAETPPQTNSWI